MPRMEATAALPSHLPATEGSSECYLAPRVWCLCVCAWPREVPTVGLRQPQENLGPRNGGRTRLQLIPRTPLAQSVVLETGPQPSPSTATFAPAPASLQRGLPRQKLPSRENCASCGVGRSGLDPRPLQPTPPTWDR